MKLKSKRIMAIAVSATIFVTNVFFNTFITNAAETDTGITDDTTVADATISESGLEGSFGGGAGTEEEPYIITCENEMLYFAQLLDSGVSFAGQYIYLANNLDLTGGVWTTPTVAFCGEFNGNGYTVTCDTQFINSIGSDGSVKLLNYTVTDNLDVSLLCETNYGVIEGCVVSGTVYTTGNAGLICNNNSGEITNCGAIGKVGGSNCYVGGVAYTNSGIIENVYSAVSVSASTSGKYGGCKKDAFVLTNTSTVSSCYYDSIVNTSSVTSFASPLTTEEMQSTDFVNTLNKNNQSVILKWVTDENLVNGGYPIPVSDSKLDISTYLEYSTENIFTYHTETLSTKILLSSEEICDIYYTLDGSDPTASDTAMLYDWGEIQITGDTIISTVACNEGIFGSVKTQKAVRMLGSGNEEDPYQIESKLGLCSMYLEPSACYVLVCDLEFNELDYTKDGACPSGWQSIEKFSGIFNGDGHKISNLKGVSGGFVTKNSGTIESVRFVNHMLVGSGVFGSVADVNAGTITRCYVNLNITEDIAMPTEYSGGIAGENNGTISYSSADGFFYSLGPQYRYCWIILGGIAGTSSGKISSCYNNTSIVLNSPYITEYVYLGGITGRGDVYDCRNDGKMNTTVSLDYDIYAAGITGHTSYRAYNCYSSLSYSGTNRGGFYSIASSNYQSYVSSLIEDDEKFMEDTFEYLDFEEKWMITETGPMPQGIMGSDGNCLTKVSYTAPLCTESGKTECINQNGESIIYVFNELGHDFGVTNCLREGCTYTSDGEYHEEGFLTESGIIYGYVGVIEDGKLEIPSVINGVSIISIEENAFVDYDLVTLVIPASVVKISDNAFKEDDIFTIQGYTQSYACNYANQKDNITFEELSPFVIEDNVIIKYTQSHITELNIPDDVAGIKAGVFNNHTEINKIVFNVGNVEIEEGAFDGCDNITIYAPYDSEVYNYAVANSIPVISNNGLPEGVTYTVKADNTIRIDKISESTLIPEYHNGMPVTEIGSGVFSSYYCTDRKVCIPATVTKISMPDEIYGTYFVISGSYAETCLLEKYNNKNGDGSLKIVSTDRFDGVFNWDIHFYYGYNIYDCNGNYYSLENDGTNLYFYDSNNNQIIITDEVGAIFYVDELGNVVDLTYMSYYGSTIDENGNTRHDFYDENTCQNISVDIYYENACVLDCHLYMYTVESLKSLTFPSKVNGYGLNSSYFDCYSEGTIENVYISKELGLVNLPELNVKNLYLSTIGESQVYEIGYKAGKSCEYIEIDESNEYYATYDGAVYDKDYTVLYYCPPLKETIKIPNTVKSIESEVFEDCWKLSDVYYDASQQEWEAISIGENNLPLLNTVIHFNDGTVLDNTSDKLESLHPYCNNMDKTWSYTDSSEGVVSLSVKFTEESELFNGDYLYIYDNENSLIKKITFENMSGAVVTVPGNSVSIRLVTDDWETAYGFEVESITPCFEYVEVKDFCLSETSVDMYCYGEHELYVNTSPENATNGSKILWASSDETVVTVENGKLYSHEPGSAIVTASNPDGFSSTCVVNVYGEIYINSDYYEVSPGMEFTLSVSASYEDNPTVTWESSNQDIATVDENGKVTVVGCGGFQIKAVADDGFRTAWCDFSSDGAVSFKESNITIAQNTMMPLEVESDYYNISDYSWQSYNEYVVSVDEEGIITANNAGYAEVALITPTGRYVWCYITVEESSIENPYYLSTDCIDLTVGEAEEINIMANGDYSLSVDEWCVRNENVATVVSDGTCAKVTAVSKGETTIYAKTSDGYYVFATVNVSPAEILPEKVDIDGNTTMYVGESQHLYVYIYPENVDDSSIYWSSSDESVAFVDESGYVTAEGSGNCIITAKTSNGLVAQLSIHCQPRAVSGGGGGGGSSDATNTISNLTITITETSIDVSGIANYSGTANIILYLNEVVAYEQVIDMAEAEFCHSIDKQSLESGDYTLKVVCTDGETYCENVSVMSTVDLSAIKQQLFAAIQEQSVETVNACMNELAEYDYFSNYKYVDGVQTAYLICENMCESIEEIEVVIAIEMLNEGCREVAAEEIYSVAGISDELMNLYYSLNDTDKADFAESMYNQGFAGSKEVNKAFGEKAFVRAINGTDTISYATEIIDNYADVVGIDMTEYNCLTETRKTEIVKELLSQRPYDSTVHFNSALKCAIDEMEADNNTSSGGVSGGGGGSDCEHSVVTDERVEPTCTETGLTEGSHCTACGEIIVAQEEIEANGHTEVIDEGYDPTYTQTGLTEGSHCSTCGEVIVEQKVIPVLEPSQTVESPSASITDGNVEVGTVITLSTETEGATIYYTLDGTTPTCESMVYTDAITITEDTTIKAIACMEGFNDSSVSVFKYLIVDENSPTISISDIKTRPGEEFQVTVDIANNTGFASLGIEIGYDSDVMTLTNAVSAEGVGGTFISAPDYSINPFNMSWDNYNNITYNGNLATLTFTVNDDVTDGIYPITVDFYKGVNGDYVDGDDTNYDENFKAIGFVYESGDVVVADHIPGDLNDDGKVNQKDATYLLRYLANWEIEDIVTSALDVNGDDSVNNKDATILLRYLAGWNVTIY